ncbi:HMA2 domain-containing protein [Methylocaldum szegediense]|uniref:Uncharacterized protein n=1 Tax=Methylocaldum szegediense TaxID=73780 RepID=A0ABM9I3L9_9GAMM|nr:hypothetical protein [Methylocaldum szegediense]CAI8869587.1 conserved protein of unknown function [Methylocaldum szegediense]
MPETIAIVHNRVPARIRIRVPLIKNKRTLAEVLKQSLLKDDRAKGIYHAEPNITTGTFLIKYHPALHTEAEVLERVQAIARGIAAGTVEFTVKHKNPKLSKMQPQAFFNRELLVSIGGNVIAGFILAALIRRG